MEDASVVKVRVRTEDNRKVGNEEKNRTEREEKEVRSKKDMCKEQIDGKCKCSEDKSENRGQWKGRK